jgi:hypothetical protein
MIYKLGRLLQFIGLAILPVAIAGQAAYSLSLGQMLTWASVGVALFMIGYWLQQSGRGEG